MPKTLACIEKTHCFRHRYGAPLLAQRQNIDLTVPNIIITVFSDTGKWEWGMVLS